MGAAEHRFSAGAGMIFIRHLDTNASPLSYSGSPESYAMGYRYRNDRNSWFASMMYSFGRLESEISGPDARIQRDYRGNLRWGYRRDYPILNWWNASFRTGLSQEAFVSYRIHNYRSDRKENVIDLMISLVQWHAGFQLEPVSGLTVHNESSFGLFGLVARTPWYGLRNYPDTKMASPADYRQFGFHNSISYALTEVVTTSLTYEFRFYQYNGGRESRMRYYNIGLAVGVQL